MHCYYLGGYVSKYKVRISSKKLALYSLIYLAAYFIYEYSWRYSCAIAYKNTLQYSYVDVMQPFVCAMIFAFLCFMIAVNIKVPSRILPKAFGSLSASTIGIYIFHYNFISLSYIIADTFWWHDWSQKGYFSFVILNSLLLMIAGYVIDLFRLLRRNRLLLVEERWRTEFHRRQPRLCAELGVVWRYMALHGRQYFHQPQCHAI